MNTCLDFRLFWGPDEKDLIVMADEEIVYKIKSEMTKNDPKSQSIDKHFERLKPVNDQSSSLEIATSSLVSPEKPQPRRSFFEKIKGKVQEMFKKGVNFYFKKYVFLPKNLEKKEFTADPVRMLLLAYQSIQEVQQMKYVLDKRDYSYYAASYLNLKLGQYKELKEINIMEEIKNVIPQIILNTNPNQYWVQEVKQAWKKQTEDLLKENEKTLKQYEGNRQVSGRNTLKRSPYEYIAASLILTNIIPNQLYGLTLFLVQSHKGGEFNQDNFPKSVYLGVDLNSVKILHPGSKELLTQFTFEIIKNILHYPKMIIFELAANNQRFRFNTYKSLEIKELITEYKILQELCGSPRRSSKN